MAARPLAAAVVVLAGCGLDWTVPEGDGAAGNDGGASSGDSGFGASGWHGASSGGSTAIGGTAGAGGVIGSGGFGGLGGTASSSSSSSSSTGPGPCDSGSCLDCDECAYARGCSAEYDACSDDVACYSLGECVYGECSHWGHDECIEWCESFYPTAVITFEQYARCVVCDQCATTCAQYAGYWRCP